MIRQCFRISGPFRRMIGGFPSQMVSNTQFQCLFCCYPEQTCRMADDLRYHDGTVMCRTLQRRHDEPVGVLNQQPQDCLLNRLFKGRSKKISKLRVTGLCAENSPASGEFPHKGPVTLKTFPLDDVIVSYGCCGDYTTVHHFAVSSSAVRWWLHFDCLEIQNGQPGILTKGRKDRQLDRCMFLWCEIATRTYTTTVLTLSIVSHRSYYATYISCHRKYTNYAQDSWRPESHCTLCHCLFGLLTVSTKIWTAPVQNIRNRSQRNFVYVTAV